MTIDWNWSRIIPLTLIGVGVLVAFVGPTLLTIAGLIVSQIRGRLPSREKTRSTDQQPPEGFIDHVNTLLDASALAPADVRLEYLAEGYTEAQTLRAEVERMGRKGD
jgi:hypothetical protein